MTTTQDILRIGVSAQALNLAGANLKVASNNLKKKNKKPLKNIVKLAATNIMAIPLLQVQSQMIGDI